MKFTIEIADPIIEQYDYEGNVIGEDEFSIKNYMMSQMKKALNEKFKTGNLNELIQQQVNAKIDVMVRDGIIYEISNLSDRFITEYLDRKIVETDRWGEEKYKGTLREKIHKAFDDYMIGTVDEKGRPSNSRYDTLYERSEYMIQHILEEKMEKFTEKTIKDVKVAVEEKLTEELKFAVGKGVVDSIGIPKLLENIKGK